MVVTKAAFAFFFFFACQRSCPRCPAMKFFTICFFSRLMRSSRPFLLHPFFVSLSLIYIYIYIYVCLFFGITRTYVSISELSVSFETLTSFFFFTTSLIRVNNTALPSPTTSKKLFFFFPFLSFFILFFLLFTVLAFCRTALNRSIDLIVVLHESSFPSNAAS